MVQSRVVKPIPQENASFSEIFFHFPPRGAILDAGTPDEALPGIRRNDGPPDDSPIRQIEQHGTKEIMKYNPARHRLPVCDVSGILLVDKPREWTSFDVVNFVRSRFNVPKVGHCGTLDPAATGLLVLVLGSFTRASDRFSGADKSYHGTIRLGVETDSGDLDGAVTAEHDPSEITEERFREVCESFRGDSMQLPPMVSAVKVGGKKLYELARKGIEVEREPRPITITRFTVERWTPPEAEFTVSCSKGTYIRVLCADIGRKLGCGAVLASLRRLRSGRFNVADAITVDTLKTMDQNAFRDHVIAGLMRIAKEEKTL